MACLHLRVRVPFCLLLVLAASCGSDRARRSTPSADGGRDAAEAEHDAGESARDAGQHEGSYDGDAGNERDPDPFAPMDVDGGGLVNVSRDLEEVLEGGELQGACKRYKPGESSRREKLLCGKAMFFYEGFGQAGVPAPLYDFLAEHFEDSLGPAYTKLGLIEDPFAEKPRNLGVAPGKPTGGGVETLAFTCANCHFSQLPDGRYAVGAPNLDYEYGTHVLATMLIPLRVSPTFDPDDHHPDALAAIQPALDRIANDPALRAELGLELLPLLGDSRMNAMSKEIEGYYASWPEGTMDFVIPPLPVDDGVHTVSRIHALFGIPDEDEREQADMPHAMLGWTGSTRSLTELVRAFLRINGGDTERWTPSAVEPLVDYIRTLRPPDPVQTTDPDRVAQGRTVFNEAGCIDCHQGPRGSGTRVFPFDEIGTDDAIKRWGDADLSGELCCGLGEGPPTHGIKAPRLTALFAKDRFLHNGSVGSLQGLLCRGGDRQGDGAEPMGNGGHRFGCDLSSDDKDVLLAFLNTL